MKFLIWFIFLVFSLPEAGEVRGRVIDKNSRQPLEWVRVEIKGRKEVEFTDKKGEFCFKNLEGKFKLRFYLSGYKPFESKLITLGAEESLNLEIELLPEAIILKEIPVTAEPEEVKPTVPSVTRIKGEEIEKTPTFGDDPLRILPTLSGVVSVIEYGNAFCVRGGNPDQNLILVDGMVIGYPFHLGGFAASFNSDNIKEIILYTGAFPAEYGNKLSSVVDVKLREKTPSRQGTLQLSSHAVKFSFQSPLGKRFSLLASLRRTYSELLWHPIWSGFYDFQKKLVWRVSPKNKLILSCLFSEDFYDTEKLWGIGTDLLTRVIFKKGFRVYGINWRSVLSEKVFLTTLLYRRDYYEKRTLEEIRGGYTIGRGKRAEARVNTTSLSQKLTLLPSEAHHLELGGEVSQILSQKSLTSFEETSLTTHLPHREEYQASVFIQDRWQITPKFTLLPGLRVNYYTPHQELCLAPRFSLEYMLSEGTLLKSGVGWYFQPNITLEEHVSDTLLGTWWNLESLDRLESSWGNHIVAGIEKKVFFLGDLFKIRLEAYHKEMFNLVVGPPLTPQDLFAAQQNFWARYIFEETAGYTNEGTGIVNGVELLVKKSLTKEKRDFGWLSYTLAWAKCARAGGEMYPSRYDRRHLLSLVYGIELGKKKGRSWWIGAKLLFSSGFPYTPFQEEERTYILLSELSPSGRLVKKEERYRVPVYGKENSRRYPFYARADIRFERKWKKGSLYLDVTNVIGKRVELKTWWYGDILGFFPVYPVVGLTLRF